MWKTTSGGSVIRLTSFEGAALGAPAWYPDGSQIVISAVEDNHSRIFLADEDGGPLRPVVGGDYNDRTPVWSPDSEWIYFAPDRTGAWQIWRVPAEGGSAEQITREGGFRPRFSPEGDSLYFVQHGLPGLWVAAAAGGNARQIHYLPEVHDWGTWDVTDHGIILLERGSSDRLLRLNPATVTCSVLADLSVNVVSGRRGMTVDRTLRRAVVSFSRGFESDLFMVDEYQ